MIRSAGGGAAIDAGPPPTPQAPRRVISGATTEKVQTLQKSGKPLKTILKVTAVGMLSLGAVAALAPSAFAASYGNTTKNCYGIFWNTDWNQECGSGGATSTGYYTSKGNCDLELDKSIEVYRKAGNRTSYDGPDCTFEVTDVDTSYSSSN
jgi:hypothetical protein